MMIKQNIAKLQIDLGKAVRENNEAKSTLIVAMTDKKYDEAKAALDSLQTANANLCQLSLGAVRSLESQNELINMMKKHNSSLTDQLEKTQEDLAKAQADLNEEKARKAPKLSIEARPKAGHGKGPNQSEGSGR